VRGLHNVLATMLAVSILVVAKLVIALLVKAVPASIVTCSCEDTDNSKGGSCCSRIGVVDSMADCLSQT